MKEQYLRVRDLIMSTPQKKTQEKGGCQCCAYVLGGDTAHSALHCGYEYFQQPAKDRKVVKLSSFPAVAAEHACDHWYAKSS
jgi:hypothetical protein